MNYIISIVIAGISMVESIWYRYKHKEELKSYNPATKFAAGIGLIIAVAGIIVNEIGGMGGAYIFVIGILLSFVVCIPAINKDSGDYYTLLKEGRFSRKQLRCIHPLRTWFGHAMGGMGLISRIILKCTIIGIPIVKMTENSSDFTDYFNEQLELREEAKELERKSLTLAINKELRKG